MNPRWVNQLVRLVVSQQREEVNPTVAIQEVLNIQAAESAREVEIGAAHAHHEIERLKLAKLDELRAEIDRLAPRRQTPDANTDKREPIWRESK